MQRTIFEPEHELFRQSVRAFIDKEIVPHFLDWENAGIVDRELFRKAGDAGFLAMDAPEAYGGGAVVGVDAVGVDATDALDHRRRPPPRTASTAAAARCARRG